MKVGLVGSRKTTASSTKVRTIDTILASLRTVDSSKVMVGVLLQLEGRQDKIRIRAKI